MKEDLDFTVPSPARKSVQLRSKGLIVLVILMFAAVPANIAIT